MVNKKRATDILKKLLYIPTAPFNEHSVLHAITIISLKSKLFVEKDRYGNIIVSTNKKTPELMLCSHADHPGFEVDSVKGNICQATFYGGVPLKYFQGTKVTLYSSQDHTRICEGKIIHAKEDKRKDAKTAKIIIPTTIQKNSAVKKGDIAVWSLPDPQIRKRTMHARSIDDIGGCAAALSSLIELKKSGAKQNISCIFTRAEEQGFIGAIAAAKNCSISKATPILSVECSNFSGRAEMGGGPIVRAGDSTAIFDPQLTKMMTRIAARLKKKNKRFNYQRKLMDGGTCEATAFQAYGYRTAGISLPLGNYHNIGKKKIEPEHISIDDYLNMIDLIVRFAKEFRKKDITKGAEFKRTAKKLDEIERNYRKKIISNQA